MKYILVVLLLILSSCKKSWTPSYAIDICGIENSTIEVYIDFSVDEFFPRIQILENGKNILSNYKGFCASGSGNGFSNKVGSHCTSLGKYKVICEKTMKCNYPAFILEGLEESNSNARLRGILLHPSNEVSLWHFGIKKKYPNTSQGCFAVDWDTYEIIRQLYNQQNIIYIYAKS